MDAGGEEGKEGLTSISARVWGLQPSKRAERSSHLRGTMVFSWSQVGHSKSIAAMFKRAPWSIG